VTKRTLISIAAAIPVALLAFSAGGPLRRTGAPIDGGLDCSQCHTSFGAANSDSAGTFTINTPAYKPGTTQILTLTIAHPQASNWGFQITARAINDPAHSIGSFAASDFVQVRCDDNNTTNGSLGPCTGSLEFAEQTAAAVLPPATSGAVTYMLNWTAPASDVGDITFYASAVAGNNDHTVAGDRVYTTSLRVQNGGGCGLTKKPALRTVVDAAQFKPALAPGGLITIYGTDFQSAGNKRTAGPGDIRNNQFPQILGCIGVQVNGQAVPITYAQFDQINAQLPAGLTTGAVQVRVIANPGSPNEFDGDVGTATLQNYAPAFFTFNGSSVAALSTNYVPVADPAVVSTGHPAKPGDVVLLYATGLGPTSPAFAAGAILDPSTTASLPTGAAFSITIGGTTLAPSDVLYAGATPGSISGLYQINARIPASTPDGDIPISISTGGVASPSGTTIKVKR
jgi:uncharacterized protein (TIGR03437 family)